MRNTTWKHGDWNAICDVCGVKFKMSQLKKRWDGLLVCQEDWEMRHPMDFIRLPDEKIAVIESRPEAPDTFIPVNYINQYFETDYIEEIPPFLYVSYDA